MIRGLRIFRRFGLKLLALLLGAMSWYLIQDAIRLESAQRKATFEPPASRVSTNSVLHLENVPITVLTRPGPWDWGLDTRLVKSVWIEGTAEALNRIEISTVRAFVDGSVIQQPGEYAMPVRVYLPLDSQVKAATDPALVRVSVKPALKGGP